MLIKNVSAMIRLLEEYHVGLQLLGIGRNGHIGFNEPGSSLMVRLIK